MFWFHLHLISLHQNKQLFFQLFYPLGSFSLCVRACVHVWNFSPVLCSVFKVLLVEQAIKHCLMFEQRRCLVDLLSQRVEGVQTSDIKQEWQLLRAFTFILVLFYEKLKAS